ncbi:hypothetical protein DICPUDRAFT_159817 [Dictyostelium purpureum]|uniref:Uncharacterized protein n=1 Tax=Dictyostelium purpureum TaxID=5786 RepID=F1A517_DICPU|nr:uncharacterized protein DICPUDRAFT_159817 [Dictyostelium purpureum]EGC28713.1 hypothetical protein DICPUDRAFT_159817 [Dictyostelium purpureum]|eukprot:XP_003294762.1 hypothetical protein DICPUDRAFT_159817 [Dictyostelium purpureum]
MHDSTALFDPESKLLLFDIKYSTLLLDYGYSTLLDLVDLFDSDSKPPLLDKINYLRYELDSTLPDSYSTLVEVYRNPHDLRNFLI